MTSLGEEFDELWDDSVRRAEDTPGWDGMTLEQKKELASRLKREAAGRPSGKTGAPGSPRSSSGAG